MLGAPETILSAFLHLELGPDPHPFLLLRSASWGAPEDEPPGWVSASGPPPLYETVFSSVGLEKSHISSAAGTPHSIIQHRVHEVGFPRTDASRPLARNLGALQQPFLPNHSLIYWVTLGAACARPRG